MHSFIFTAAATLFFGAVSALPIPQSSGAAALVAAVVTDVSDVGNAVPVEDVKKLVSDAVENTLNLRDSPLSLPAILQNVITQVEPLVEQLSAYQYFVLFGMHLLTHISLSLPAFTTVENATEAALGPIASSLESILSAAAAEVENLLGQPLEIILGAVNDDGKAAVADLAKTVSDLVTITVGALNQVATLEGSKIQTLVATLFSDTETTLGDLLNNLEAVVTGLKNQLVPLIAQLIPIIYNLNLADIIAFLGLPALV
ncbi:hypothetical protein HWV62_16814 [Athelia sp. TMB]|nr:hypothetical protein HWV62_16814 [Athelia sp. TMB]